MRPARRLDTATTNTLVLDPTLLITLPDTMQNLHALEQLSLNHVPTLTSVPEAVLALRNLRILNLTGTPVT